MGHWYTRDGDPMHEVKDAKGNPRPTTLRDARKLGLFPSVTTINKATGGSPQLTDWIVNQALLSALNHPGGVPNFHNAARDPVSDKDQKVKDFLQWCREDSYKQVRDKAELGNAIHDALNKSFVDPDDVPAHFLAHVNAVRSLLARHFGEDRVWIPERTFACPGEGFGGSIDLDSDEGDVPVLVDFKCKEFDEGKPVKSMIFDEHVQQLGGYRIARTSKNPKYANARCVNVIVSTSVPGLAVMHEHSAEDMERGEQMFRATLAFWRAKNKYFPA